MSTTYDLSDEQLHRLQEYFESEASEESLDFVGAHGFITAIAISPETIPTEEWQQVLLGESEAPADIAALLSCWWKAIHSRLYHDDTPILPCTLDPEGDDLCNWCSGFLEALFLREDAWYATEEEAVAALTMPMLVFSGLVEDEEIRSIRRNRKIINDMAKRLPEILGELYLLFHAPAQPITKGGSSR